MVISRVIFFLLFFMSFLRSAFSQGRVISGYVEDQNTGERIINAYVTDTISKQVTQTNNFGFFNLKTSAKNAALQGSFIGMKSDIITISCEIDTFILISVEPVLKLKEVVIASSQYERHIKSPPGLIIVPVTKLTAAPALGETDLLKSIQNLPGIKGGIEGSSGIFVRGGSGGENLFMLDDVPLYNVSHLYGFFSAFNSSAVKDIKIIKGSFPARYGGRTSSVIDVRSRDGSNKSLKGEAALSMLSAKFTLEGPLYHDKTTFIVSGRRSYFDLYSEALKNLDLADEGFPGYKFYDINARIVHSFTPRDKIYLGFYNGRDRILYEHRESVSDRNEIISEQNNELSGWGNLTGSFRWNHLFGKKLFSNNTMAFTRYNFFINKNYSYSQYIPERNYLLENKYMTDYLSGLSDFIIKSDFEYVLSDKHKLLFGAGNTFHSFNPGRNDFKLENKVQSIFLDTTFINPESKASELFVYLENESDVTERLKVNAGMRMCAYIAQDISRFHFEPRFSSTYLVRPGLSAKAGYSRMAQNLHLISNSGVTLPTDLWVPAINGLHSLKSDQANAGVVYEINKKLCLTIEFYHKWLYNTTDLKNGESILTSIKPWYEKTTQGTGHSKGIEVTLEKYLGDITGSINYTLSKASRKYSDLNNGKSFPFRYDRLHDLNLSVNYKISEKWDIAFMWIYGTGYPVTVPVEKYLPGLSNIMPKVVYYYPSINNFRLPDYHRLDMSLHYRKISRHGENILRLDVFNAYNRKNPVNISFYETFSHEYIYLLPIIPSVSYTLRF